MTQPNYEQKKQECWDALWDERTTLPISHEPLSQEEIFNYAFDRAYALGKEKETVSQEEIRKAAVEYAEENMWYPGETSYEDDINDMTESFADAFESGAKFALGKQENDAEDGSLWSRLTDDEKREMQSRYHTNECVLRDHKKRTGDKAQSKAVARMKLLENLFGKDNLKVEKK